jgi:protein-S-isoprenylcysteine O-methyltransferase Ste14
MDREIVTVGLVLSINLLVTIGYLLFMSSETRKERFFKMPVWLQKSFVLLFIGPLFISPFLSQPSVHILAHDWLRIPLGFLFIFSGLAIIILAFLKIGAVPSLRKKSSLITAGVYGIVRHPIYSGTLIAFLGVILLSEALVSLVYFPVSAGLYYLMTVHEEKVLIAEYGREYLAYRQKVRKRILPYIL